MRHVLLTHVVLFAATAAIVAGVRPARAEDASTVPATTASSAEKMRVTVNAVQGLVQVRDTEDGAWRKAIAGEVVLEDAEFRTGPRSAVQLVIPPDQTITLDRLGTVKLLQAMKENGKIYTNVGMKYGRTRYDIEAAGQEHEASITSPNSTLAIRGTRVSLFDQRPFNPQAVSLTGRANFRDGKKQLAFGNKGQGKTVVQADQPDAGSVALAEAVVDPTVALARSESEEPLVSTLLSRGSTVFFDRDAGIKVVTGGVPPTDAELIPALPGQLNFVLRWNTDADLNFSVGSPGGKNNAGEVLYPVAGLSRNSTGGRTDFDHRGGPNGGIEIAYWPSSYPQGLYGLGVILARGETTTATVDTFIGGQRVDIYDGTQFVSTATVDVTPPIPGIGEGTAVGIVGIGVDIPGVDNGNEPGGPPSNDTSGEPGAPPTLASASTVQLASATASVSTKKASKSSLAKTSAAPKATAAKKPSSRWR